MYYNGIYYRACENVAPRRIYNTKGEFGMSIRFEISRNVRVRPEPVFAALLDLDSAKDWMQGLVGIERLDDGQLRVGSQWKETRKMYGTQATEFFEVMEIKEFEKIVFRCDGTKGTTGKGEYLFTYILRPIHDGTEIILHGEIGGLTGLAKWFGKLISGTFKKACAKDLDALIPYLESQ